MGEKDVSCATLRPCSAKPAMQGEEESTLRPVLRSSPATEGGSMSPVIK